MSSQGPFLFLDSSRSERAFLLDESVWQIELRRMFELCESHRGALRRFADEGPERAGGEPPHLSLAIFGTYGAGKSSLLRTFVEQVNRADSPLRPRSLEGRIRALPVVEPNIQADEDHFLYAFLATALEEDRRRVDDRQGRGAAEAYRLSSVQQAFQEVSEYLQVIDRPPGKHDHDPLGVSLDRLERHTSDLFLREKLKLLIKELADSLAGPGKDSILLLPVDDADHSHKNLVATLETFRRYLTHPRLVPVFTFTGRLAEELLRVEFARELSVKEKWQLQDRLREPATSLDMTEHLAYQYLVKLFPIRNRIRMGPAPARVQRGRYVVSGREDDGGGSAAGRKEGRRGEKVWDLLETASRLLFGHPEWPITPRVRLLLRPVTLRRQLQVLDAVHDARVAQFLVRERQAAGGEEGIEHPSANPFAAGFDQRKRSSDDDPARGVQPWSWVFVEAAWSALNVHRDVLREFGLHPEDLQSRTPRNIRHMLLESVLAASPDIREILIQRWRYRIPDRRGQVISLLAASAFRPQMEFDEPSGDDPDRVRREGRRADVAGLEALRARSPDRPPPVWPGERIREMVTFSSHLGILWLLDLWVGFYLPLALLEEGLGGHTHGQRHPHGSPGGHGQDDEWHEEDALATGWTLWSGPAHAIDVAARFPEREYAGTAFLRLPENLDAAAKRAWPALAFQVWCNYGSQNRAWVAVSFWRGLGLLGQLVDDYDRITAPDAPAGAAEAGDFWRSRRHLDRIETLVQKHCASTRRPGWEVDPSLRRARWDGPPPAEQVSELAWALQCWLEYVGMYRIDPMLLHLAGTSARTPGDFIREQWVSCFTRVLHGEYLMGDLWPRLEGTSPEPRADGGPDPRAAERGGERTARTALEDWTGILLDYLRQPLVAGAGATAAGAPRQTTLAGLLRVCPLLAPWCRARGGDEPDPDDAAFRTFRQRHAARLQALAIEHVLAGDERWKSFRTASSPTGPTPADDRTAFISAVREEVGDVLQRVRAAPPPDTGGRVAEIERLRREIFPPQEEALWDPAIEQVREAFDLLAVKRSGEEAPPEPPAEPPRREPRKTAGARKRAAP